jgi:hypothetical protein
MSSLIKSTPTKDIHHTKGVSSSQLEHFIRRAAKAKMSTPEPGSGESWTLINSDKAKKMGQVQEEDEWVVVEVEMLEGV